MRSLRFCALIPLLLAAPALAGNGPSAERPFGLERRLPWNDSRVVGSPDPPLPYKTVRAFPGLTVQRPVSLTPEPGTDRLFIISHLNFWSGPGRLVAARDDQGTTTTETLLEIDGLAHGLAFHPNYERNGYIYIGLGRRGVVQVLRYTVDRRKPHHIDPRSRREIIQWESHGHEGGDVAFGADGMLFVTTGDGSAGSDARETGQRIDDLQGSVLRIDVDHPGASRPYSIPKDNPFLSRPNARPEVWAYGLRNPWRISFDRKSGQLWVGNNGQDAWEQVFLIKKGGNYGWSLFEGGHLFLEGRKAGPDPITLPVADHPHSEARSLTGGQVYRGTRLPELDGVYVYGDWSTGRVWGVRHDGKATTWHKELVDTPFNITGFGTDHSGELYIIDQASGGFYRLERTSEADRPIRPFPTRLSETGLFASVAAHRPHAAALPFEVNAPQWADGATMVRFAAFPGLERVVQKPQLNAGGAWTLPNGSVLVQTLSLDQLDDAGKLALKRVETRLLVRQQGEWTGYSYRWNDAQTDAELVPADGGGTVFDVPDKRAPEGRRELAWRFPARTECLTCHSRAAGFILAFTPLQLDRDHDYGGVTDNQLRTLEHIGVFEDALTRRPADRPRLVNPYEAKAPLEARVKSYLHVNCSVCHVNEGGGNSRMELGLDTPPRSMRIIDEVPTHDNLGIKEARIIAPGSPARSVLYQRISRRSAGKMPPLVSTEVDRDALTLIGEWIRSLPAK